MVSIQEQIEELKANPIVGGLEWEIAFGSCTIKCNSINSEIDVTFYEEEGFCLNFANCNEIFLTSTTLKEALLEAIEIVKAKVSELAKELGLDKYRLLDEEHKHLVELNSLLVSENESLRNDLAAYEQAPTKEWIIKQAKELGLIVFDGDKTKNRESIYDAPDFSKSWQKLGNERYTFKGKRTDNGEWVQGQFEPISMQYGWITQIDLQGSIRAFIVHNEKVYKKVELK